MTTLSELHITEWCGVNSDNNTISEDQAVSNTTTEQITPALSVVVPAYNEEARIQPSLEYMLKYLDALSQTWEMIVVNDGSSDQTVAKVQSVLSGRPNAKLLSYCTNRGKGHAVRVGMLHAKGERVLFSDADLATPIEELSVLSAALDAGADIAIGSRDLKGSRLDRRQSIIRELGGKAFNRVVRMLTVPGIHDTQCGFKLFTRAASQSVFSECKIDNFAFDVEVLYIATKIRNLKIAEIPVRWSHQEGSKVRFLRDGIRMLMAIKQIRNSHSPNTIRQGVVSPR